MPESMTLKTLLAESALTRALHRGDVTSELVTLDLAPVKKANTAFKPFVRENAFDAGELAIVTYLQASDASSTTASPTISTAAPSRRRI